MNPMYGEARIFSMLAEAGTIFQRGFEAGPFPRETMRKEALGVAVAFLMVISLGAGYFAGGGRTSTVTITSTSTVTAQETITSTITSTTTLAPGPGQPISVSAIETANLTVGRVPGYLAVNPSAGRVYDAVGSSLIVIDASSHFVVANVTLPSGSSGVVVDPITGMVLVSVEGGIAEVNGSTNVLVGELHLNSSVGELAFNPSTDTVYTSGGLFGQFGANGSLIGLDVRTGSVVANVSLGFPPYNLALNPETNIIYAEGCHQEGLACDSMVSIVNGTSRAVVATVSLSSAYYSTMTYDVPTNIVYASGGSELVALNGTTGARVFLVNPETCGPFIDMGVIPSLDQVLMVPQNYDYLLVYNGTSGALVNMYSYSSLSQSNAYLQSVAYNPDSHELYLTTSSGQFLAFPDSNILGNVNATTIGAGQTCLPV